MLNKKEKAIMWIVYDKAMTKNKSCIVSHQDIIKELPPKMIMGEDEVQTILEQLDYDGYFEVTSSEKKDQPVMVIELRQKGQAFPREMTQAKRQIRQRIITTVLFSALGAIVALTIRSLFG